MIGLRIEQALPEFRKFETSPSFFHLDHFNMSNEEKNFHNNISYMCHKTGREYKLKSRGCVKPKTFKTIKRRKFKRKL